MRFDFRMHAPQWGFVAALAALGIWNQSARADLFAYLQRPEPKFAWQLREKNVTDKGTIYELHLVSQEWHGITWEHQLQIYQPKNVAPNRTMFLYNTGGRAKSETIALGLNLAQQMQAPVAFLYHIPNQPLLGDKKEDALIAETFVRYLDTRDATWPLLFAMVKSVIKAMDALQAFAKAEWQSPIDHFIISGASKRGWTSWLTGAADPRVKAIAPMVIDTLNMTKQMDYQKFSFGAYSDQVADYTERGLVPLPNTDDARRLWKMVDPFFYRDRLTMPKLLINGNNDEYWTVDALNLYWDELKGEKYVTYVPNAGHNLQQNDATHKEDRTRAIQALAAFARHQITDRPLPRLEWKHDNVDGHARLTVQATPAPKTARLWVASAPTRDFRKVPWHDEAASVQSAVSGTVPMPTEGFRAFYADLDYEIDGIPYHLCTQIRVLEAKK